MLVRVCADVLRRRRARRMQYGEDASGGFDFGFE